MGTRVVTASLSSGYEEKYFYDGDTIVYGTNVSSESAVEGTIVSASLNISNFRVYSGSCYMDVYIGGTKVAETVEMDLDDYGGGSAGWVEIELEYLKPALLTASGSITLICYNNNNPNSTVRTYGTTSSGFCEVVVQYNTQVIGPSIQWNKGFSVVDENYKVKATWDKATPINGAGPVTYYLVAAYEKDGQYTEQIMYSGTATTVTFDPPVYNISVSYRVCAYSNGADNSGIDTSSISLTITLPEATHYTVRCYLNDGWQDCIVKYYDGYTWQECIVKYYDGSNWKDCSF